MQECCTLSLSSLSDCTNCRWLTAASGSPCRIENSTIRRIWHQRDFQSLHVIERTQEIWGAAFEELSLRYTFLFFKRYYHTIRLKYKLCRARRVKHYLCHAWLKTGSCRYSPANVKAVLQVKSSRVKFYNLSILIQVKWNICNNPVYTHCLRWAPPWDGG